MFQEQCDGMSHNTWYSKWVIACEHTRSIQSLWVLYQKNDLMQCTKEPHTMLTAFCTLRNEKKEVKYVTEKKDAYHSGQNIEKRCVPLLVYKDMQD